MSLENPQKRRALVAGVLICIPLLLLIARLYHIQIASSEELRKKAQKQYMMTVRDLAPRGDIVCMNGNSRVTLATSEMRKTLSVNPRQIVTDREDLAAKLAEILGMDSQDILGKLNNVTTADGKPNYYVRIKRFLTSEEAKKIEDLDVPGLSLKDEPRRVYLPQARVLGNIIGLVGYDDENLQNKGLEGLELYYDGVLHGEPGRRDVLVDALGNQINIEGYREIPAKKGCNLLLTINPKIQQIVEEELKAAYDQWKPESATAIVMDPYTGDILAMVNFPDFDPNNPGAYDPETRRNRAITDCYEPGSTFKPLVGCGVLEEGVCTLDTTVKCFGPVCGREIGDHVSGWLTYREVIVRSSNRGAAQAGVMLDQVGKLRPWVLKYGFGKPTGVDLPGEIGGIVTPASQWTRQSSAVSVSFGQEIAVTPLQLVRAFCCITNGGLLVQPRIVKAILDSQGNVIHDIDAITKDRAVSEDDLNRLRRIVTPAPPQRIMLEETAKKMQTVLPLVVSDPSGTGYRSRLKEYAMAGKTGTAQKMSGGAMSHSLFVGYFVGYAPVSDPKICVIVVMNEPRGAYYGGTVAAPAVSKIILRSLRSMGVAEEAPAGNPAPARRNPR
jgi:cell division protein FtsI/penicillin-binding protein 2